MDFDIAESEVANLVQDLLSMKYTAENEYTVTGLHSRAFDRFLFPDVLKHLGAAVPVLGTRRPGMSGVAKAVDGSFLLYPPLFIGNLKSTDIEMAIKETLALAVNQVEGRKTFPAFMGLPCTTKEIALQLYLTANKKLLYVDIAIDS